MVNIIMNNNSVWAWRITKQERRQPLNTRDKAVAPARQRGKFRSPRDTQMHPVLSVGWTQRSRADVGLD